VAYAGPFSSGHIRDLHVKPQNATVFTKQNCGYVLTLPGIEPEDVQTSLPELPASVSFQSSKRTEYIGVDGTHGTRLELWFVFSDPGTHTLPPLGVTVRRRSYNLVFDPVVVYENPATAIPGISVKFQTGIYSEDGSVIATARNKPVLHALLGEPVIFTVYLQYAVQVPKFDWDLQKDALFTELDRYEITKGHPRGSGFSAEEIPVAKFRWEPLSTGNWSLPVVRITATAYNGSRTDLVLPDYVIAVSESDTSLQNSGSPMEDEKPLFAYAFSAPAENVSSAEKSASPDSEKIAELRSAERHSFPCSTAERQRQELEIRSGLEPGAAEPSIPLFHLCRLLAVLACAAAVVLLLARRIVPGVLVLCFTAAALFFSILFAVQLSPRYGIFSGGRISPIPEKNSAATVNISGGVRVRILETAGGWIYIEYNDSGGWVTQNCVFLIE
jgi:hypothetical protein